MQRRHFLKNSAMLSAAGYLNLMMPSISWGSEKNLNKKYVVMITVDGGWDTTLATDPWIQQRPSEKEIFVEYRHDELLRFGNGLLGPSLKPLEPYFSKMSVVNGLFLSSTDLGHPLQSYSQTGNGQGDLASLPAEWAIASQETSLGTFTNSSVRTGGKSIFTFDMTKISKGKIASTIPFKMDQKFQTELHSARETIMKLSPNMNDFNAMTAQYSNSESLRPGQIVAAAFKQGLSNSADFTHSILTSENQGLNIDSHAAHEKSHLEALTAIFAGVKNFMDDLAAVPTEDSTSILDHTTILVVSDFTRTPALNSTKGKDHNPQTNSMIVIGPQIRSEQIIGASRLFTQKESPTGTPMLVAMPLDKQTLQPTKSRENAFMLRPENVIATVYSSLGINPASISQGFQKTAILKNLLK